MTRAAPRRTSSYSTSLTSTTTPPWRDFTSWWTCASAAQCPSARAAPDDSGRAQASWNRGETDDEVVPAERRRFMFIDPSYAHSLIARPVYGLRSQANQAYAR